MPTQSTTTATATATSANATWVWRDLSSEGLVPGAAPQAGPPRPGCF
jgi:hypothetical protein